MVELRWVWVDEKKQPPLGAIFVGEKACQKLQYRIMTNIMEFGIQHAIWGEWRDVPHDGFG